MTRGYTAAAESGVRHDSCGGGFRFRPLRSALERLLN